MFPTALPPVTHSVVRLSAADRHVIRRAAVVVGLGNYTHPKTRHSIGQYCLSPLMRLAESHDQALRREIARRVSRLPPDAPTFKLPETAPIQSFRHVRASKGWLACVSVLLDSAPSKGSALRRAPDFRLGKYPYVLFDLVFYIPRVLMNVNGTGVASALRMYPDVTLEHAILVHDELQRPFGKVAFKAGGSAAGHNGVRSVQQVLRCGGRSMNQPDIARIRIGIDRPQDPSHDVGAYVLSAMPPAWLTACDFTPDGTPGPVLQQLWQVLHSWCLSHIAPSCE